MTKNHAFRIVAACEDFGAVVHAQELSKRLAAELKPGREISSDTWKFEALDKLRARQDAATAVTKADLVIIAASGEVEPPVQIKNWIKSWPHQNRKRVTALVPLLEDAATQEARPLCAYLRRIAAKRGMEFFSTCADWWHEYLESTHKASHHQRETPRPELMESLTRITWGGIAAQ